MKGLPDIQNYSSRSYRNIEELRGRKDPAAISAAAKEMEALFALELIKAMRGTSQTSEKSFGKDTYMSMFDMELARILAERGFGLKEVLLKGLNRAAAKTEAPGKNRGPGTQDPQDPLSETVPVIHAHPDAIVSKGKDPVVRDGETALRAAAIPKSLPVVQASDEEDVAGLSSGELDGHAHAVPVEGVISSHYGMRTHPVHGGRHFHHGIDIAAPKGSDIYPIGGGKVVFSGSQPGYGNVVVIDHGNGLVSKYGHNDVNLVRSGDEVGADTVIARVGSTGVSTGPHLHFEAKLNGKEIDPSALVAMK